MNSLILFCSLIIFSSCDADPQVKNYDQQRSENTAMKTQDNAIINAVKKNKLEEVSAALKKGVSANTTDSQQRSLLLLASYNNDLAMAKLLIENGADVNQQDALQDSPFLYAGAEGHLELLKLYLKNGARFDIFNRYRGSALIPACERGHVETVRLLANTKGFPIDHINRLGWTALLEAIILGNGSQKYIDIVKILLEAGSDISIADGKGVTPLQHARNNNYSAIVKLLEGHSK